MSKPLILGLAIGFTAIAAVISGDYYARVTSQRDQWKAAAEASAADKSDAYPYLFVDKGDLAEGKQELRLWLGSANGTTSYVSIWISPAAANRDPNDPRYWSLARLKSGKPLVYQGATLMGLNIEPGDYFVEMSARNGTVVERLTINAPAAECAGCDKTFPAFQSISLLRDGKELHIPAAIQPTIIW